VRNAKLRVLLADDHVLVREGLKRLVDDQPDMEVVAEAVDGPEALRLARKIAPDVALIDISMPQWDGVKTTRKMIAACPKLKIVAVTRHDEDSFVRRMLRAGAAGYVLKQSPSAAMTSAIRAVARGEQYVDVSVKSPKAPVEPRPASPGPPGTRKLSLSAVQEQVLRLVALSRTTREIAAQLGMEAEEVRRLKAAAMERAHLDTRLDVIRFARERGWIERR